MYAGAVVVVVTTVGGLVLRLLLGRDHGDGIYMGQLELSTPCARRVNARPHLHSARCCLRRLAAASKSLHPCA